MKIQVLGTGCPKCTALLQATRQAVGELGLDAEVEKVDDIADIMALGVMMTPALAVDGDVRLTGKAASADEIKQLLTG